MPEQQHPLIDEICKTIYCTWPEEHETSLVCDNMRAATDWQLERVLMWIRDAEYDQYHHGKIIYGDDLKKAMRPQQKEDN